MDDLISKRDAIEAVNDALAEYIPTFRPWQERIPLECALKIKALPPVKPEQEIIHCKDCKQFRKPSSIVNADWGWCSGWPTPLTTFVKVDGFCHRAEKRGSESE